MYEIIENWSVVIIMVFILLVSIQISISNPKNLAVRLINFLISFLLLASVIIVAQNKFLTESEARIKAEMIFQENQTDDKVKNDDSKKIEANSIEKKMVYNKEKNFLIENIDNVIGMLSEIESLKEEQYNTIYAENYLFDKYRNKSKKYAVSVADILDVVKKYNFQSKLVDNKKDYTNAFDSAVKATNIFKKVFFNEQDIAYPSMVPAAKKAKMELIEIKRGLD